MQGFEVKMKCLLSLFGLFQEQKPHTSTTNTQNGNSNRQKQKDKLIHAFSLSFRGPFYKNDKIPGISHDHHSFCMGNVVKVMAVHLQYPVTHL